MIYIYTYVGIYYEMEDHKPSTSICFAIKIYDQF